VWLFSCALHVGAFVAVGAAIHHVPGGAATDSGHEIGIVLEHDAADGARERFDSYVTRAIYATSESPSAPALLVAEPTEKPASQGAKQAAQVGSASPKSSQPGGGDGYGPSRGSKATVKVFGVQGVGTKFVYVFDRSSSMEGPPLAAAKQQLIASLNSLDTIHQFQIIFFNHQTRTFDATGGGHRVAFATDRNKQLAAKFVGGITADGGTDRLSALRAAVAMQPDVIFFLTDDDDPIPESELAEVNQLNRRANATICTIQFGEGPQPKADNFLVQLARLTGGQYGYVDTTTLGK
jgi:hypothetical protein